MKYATTGRPGAVGASATVAASTIAPSEARTTETPDNAASGSRGASAGGALRGDEAAAKAVARGGEAAGERGVARDGRLRRGGGGGWTERRSDE